MYIGTDGGYKKNKNKQINRCTGGKRPFAALHIIAPARQLEIWHIRSLKYHIKSYSNTGPCKMFYRSLR